jgi:hypothetical protein
MPAICIAAVFVSSEAIPNGRDSDGPTAVVITCHDGLSPAWGQRELPAAAEALSYGEWLNIG